MLRIIAFQRSNIPQEFRVPTYLLIDEFQNFISEDIEKGLTQLRKYGLHLILANQYVGQIASPSLQKALFSAGVVIAGKNERSSLLAISKELDISVDGLTHLKIGEFVVNTLWRAPFVIQTPTLLLGGNYSISDEQWQWIRARNLRQHYRRVVAEPDTPTLPYTP